MKVEENEKILLSADALIAMVVTEMEVREMKEISILEQTDTSDFPSKRFLDKMEKLKNKAIRKRRRVTFLQITKRVFLTVAIITTIFSFALLPVHAVREAVVSTLLEWHDQFLSVFLSAESDDFSSEALSLQNIQIAYIPTGFSSSLVNNSQESFYTHYKASDGNWFTLSAYLVTAQHVYLLDNEDVKYYSLQLADKEVLWASFSEGINAILWQEGNISFELQGSLDLAELIHISESISL